EAGDAYKFQPMSRSEAATAWSPALTGTAIRRIVLEQAKRANVGHIGSALSIADIVAVLYGHVLRVPAPHDAERDRFVLAKGHAFGWNAIDCDGHDVDALAAVLAEPTQAQAPPRVVVARTTAGKGVSFMEDQLRWHYAPMSDDEYRRALDELDAAICEPRSSG